MLRPVSSTLTVLGGRMAPHSKRWLLVLGVVIACALVWNYFGVKDQSEVGVMVSPLQISGAVTANVAKWRLEAH